MDLKVLKGVRLQNADEVRRVCHLVATVEQRGDILAKAAALVDDEYSTFYSRLRGHGGSALRLADVMAVHYASRARTVEECLIWPALRTVDALEALNHSGDPMREMNDVVHRLGVLAQGIAEASEDKKIDSRERKSLEALCLKVEHELMELRAAILGKGGPKRAKS